MVSRPGRRRARGALLTVGLLVLAQGPRPAGAQGPDWPGEAMPLPLVSRSPEELALKGEAERQYLLFNLLAGGKYALDRGFPHEAVKKWERLLRLPGLPRDVEKVVTPLLTEARRLASSAPLPPAPAVVAPSLPSAPPERRPVALAPRPATGTVAGSVTGAGSAGPSATVLWLKRLDAPMPPPRPRRRVVSQKNKLFIPGVLAVSVGSSVDFRNDDDFYHNVFSLSPTAKFDTGLYKQGLSYVKTFNKPGPVELLCNIHATMLGYIYVVDSPYYTQPQGSGAFRLRALPPGRYELHAWHPGSSQVTTQTLEVAAGETKTVTVRLAGDRNRPAAVPDKYGKPRQLQLGY
jgi:plastocyanin